MIKFGHEVDQQINLPYLHGDQKWSNLVKQLIKKWIYYTCMVLKSCPILSESWSTNEVTIPAWWIKSGQICYLVKMLINKMNLPYLKDGSNLIKNGQIWPTNWSTKWIYHTCMVIKSCQICSKCWSTNEVIKPALWVKVVIFGQKGYSYLVKQLIN